jgi:hypothetical protein
MGICAIFRPETGPTDSDWAGISLRTHLEGYWVEQECLQTNQKIQQGRNLLNVGAPKWEILTICIESY